MIANQTIRSSVIMNEEDVLLIAQVAVIAVVSIVALVVVLV